MVPFSAAAPPRDCCACASDVAAWHSASTSDRRLSARLKYPMERCRSCALPVFGMSSSTSATRRYPSAASSLACAWRRTRGRGRQPGELRARIGHDRWFQQDIPRHRILFTKLGLVALVERCGFDPRWTTTRLIDQNLLGMWQILVSLVTRERDVSLWQRVISDLRSLRPRSWRPSPSDSSWSRECSAAADGSGCERQRVGERAGPGGYRARSRITHSVTRPCFPTPSYLLTPLGEAFVVGGWGTNWNIASPRQTSQFGLHYLGFGCLSSRMPCST
jgi:hypothetical protein